MSKFVSRFMKDESGATAIEYGLIAGGISLGIVAALFAFGDDLAEIFDSMAGVMSERSDEVAADLAAAP